VAHLILHFFRPFFVTFDHFLPVFALLSTFCPFLPTHKSRFINFWAVSILSFIKVGLRLWWVSHLGPNPNVYGVKPTDWVLPPRTSDRRFLVLIIFWQCTLDRLLHGLATRDGWISSRAHCSFLSFFCTHSRRYTARMTGVMHTRTARFRNFLL
jgi:hypothetical protein